MSGVKQKRMRAEIKELQKEKLSNISVYFSEDNMNVWYYLIKDLGEGKPNKKSDDETNEKVYKGGHYIGKIVLKDSYPQTAPDFQFLTPSGRFTPDSNICVTYSSYHPEAWSPSTTIKTCIIAMLSVFRTDQDTGISHISLGEVNLSKKRKEEILSDRKKFAESSIAYNKKFHKELYNNLLNNDITADAKNSDSNKKSKKESDSDSNSKKKKKDKKSDSDEDTKKTKKKKKNKKSDSDEDTKKTKKKKKNKKSDSDEDTKKTKKNKKSDSDEDIKKKKKKKKDKKKKSDSESDSDNNIEKKKTKKESESDSDENTKKKDKKKKKKKDKKKINKKKIVSSDSESGSNVSDSE